MPLALTWIVSMASASHTESTCIRDEAVGALLKFPRAFLLPLLADFRFMGSDGDPDADLMVDWRGGTKSIVGLPKAPVKLEQTYLPFKQRKITPASNVLKGGEEKSTTLPSKPQGMGPAGAANVVYLSDSDGTPRPRAVPACAPERIAKAKAAKVCNFEAPVFAPPPRIDSQVIVNLESDSDEEMVQKPSFRMQGKKASPREESPPLETRDRWNDIPKAPGITTSRRTDEHAVHSGNLAAANLPGLTSRPVRRESTGAQVKCFTSVRSKEGGETFGVASASAVFEDLTTDFDEHRESPGLGGDCGPSSQWQKQSFGLRSSGDRLGLQNDSARNARACNSSDSQSPGSRRVDSGDETERRSRKRNGAAVWEEPVEEQHNDSDEEREAPKGRSRNLSKADREARQAGKELERELKKARQEQEKKAKGKEREEKKKQKEAAKAEATERKRLEKEHDKWSKGKRALENTKVCIDAKVCEMRSLGAILLHQLSEKNYNYIINTNRIPKSILWTMKRPATDSQRDSDELGTQDDILASSQPSSSQLVLEEVEVKYVVVVLQAEEFASMVAEGKHHATYFQARELHPGYAVCFAISGLRKYLNRKEQEQYKNGNTGWERPNVEQALADLVIYHTDVHTRLCIDEAEIADLIVGLTRGHIEVPFKQKLTSIAVGVNGDHVSKTDPNKHIIKKSIWLKFLVSIPLICAATAIAIAKKYPSMRDLIKEYRDRSKSDQYKAALLENIVKEAPLGSSCPEGRRVGIAASKRIFRVLTAQNGNLNTRDVEDGADYFERNEARS